MMELQISLHHIFSAKPGVLADLGDEYCVSYNFDPLLKAIRLSLPLRLIAFLSDLMKLHMSLHHDMIFATGLSSVDLGLPTWSLRNCKFH